MSIERSPSSEPNAAQRSDVGSDSIPRRVLRLFVRPHEGGPVVEVDSIEVEAGKGAKGDHAFGRMRHLTLLFESDWAAACSDLGRDVDPIARRANVLFSGDGDGGALVGREVAIGDVLLAVKGVTAPCPVMDRAASGLKKALEPAGRGGVWTRALRGGTIRRGDELRASAPEE